MNPPLILAGPIIRQSTRESVSIWLASSSNISIVSMEFTSLNSKLETTTEVQSMQLGKRFFIYLITNFSKYSFPEDEVIEYDIITSEGRRLKDFMEIKNICLGKYSHPTFVISSENNLHLIFGSCRKFHGPGIDMMNALNNILESASNDRPTHLLLGGDQIYADDVDGDLLPIIYKISKIIMGRKEKIPGLPDLALEPTYFRGSFLDKLKGENNERIFSSTEKKFHLLTFGEFSAMYLLAWNDEIWNIINMPEKLKSKINELKHAAKNTRKAFANIPTYMIFDDHEITDDWFLNNLQRDSTLTSEGGKRIIINGLSAYWAFQGWGNNPKIFSNSFCENISKFTLNDEGFITVSAELLNQQVWSFVVPSTPPIIFLDTRTGRTGSDDFISDISPTFNSIGLRWELKEKKRNEKSPRLLGLKARDKIKQLLNESVDENQAIILVIPSPVFGNRPIEELQEFGGRFDKFQGFIGAVGPTGVDLESWASNPRNQIDFFDLFFPYNPVVILSGDVHYGFIDIVSISTNSKSIKVFQICSSALKNNPVGIQKIVAQLMQILIKVLEKPIGWWDLKKTALDGNIIRFFANKGINNSVDSTIDELHKKHGYPNFVTNEKFLQLDNMQPILLKNNLSEIILSDDKLLHRFWLNIDNKITHSDFINLSEL